MAVCCCCVSRDRVGPPPRVTRSGPLDHEEFHGVESERGCTDVAFLVLFLAFLAGLGFGLYYAAVRGDDRRIIFGYDTDGDLCGRTNTPLTNIEMSGKDNRKKPFLNIGSSSLSFPSLVMGECVESCDLSKSPPLLNRCLPGVSVGNATNWFLTGTGLAQFFNQFAIDFQICWKEVIYLCLIALGLSFVITILFRFLAGAVIWVLLAGLVLGSLGGTAYLWWVWYSMQNSAGSGSALAYATLMSVAAGLIILIVLVMRKRVELVAALFREAGKAVHSMPLLLFTPVWTLLVLVLLCAAWLYAAVWIESAGDPAKESYNSPVFFKKDTFLQVVRWYNVLAAIWLSQFCLAIQHLVIAGAVTHWFFTRDKSKLGFPLLTSTKNALYYHTGSAAFGSLLIALLKTLRLILNYIDRKMRQNSSDLCGIIKCMRCCCKCCLYLFEKFIQAICSNAYIEIAIYGENFCWSAGRAFKILSNNALRVMAINSVGDFILFLGKIGVVVATVFIGIELIKSKPGVVYIWAPILIASIFAYLIAHCFISVYEMCIDSIFICFCEDCEMNDGQLRPYFMSRGLMEFVERSKKALKPKVGRGRGGGGGRAYDNPAMNITDEGRGWAAGVPPPAYHFHPTAPPAP